MADRENYDYVFKLVIVGNAAVGKSSLLMRFADDIYKEHYSITLLDFKIRTVEIDGKIIKLQIWDTAGCETFRCLSPSYYKGADGVLLVYDCTNRKSFDSLKSWLNDVHYYAGDNIIKLLVGNKSDLTTQRVIDYSTASKYAEELGIPFLETSVKNSTNVEQAFMMMAAQMKNKVEPFLKETDTLRIRKINSTPVNSCGYC